MLGWGRIGVLERGPPEKKHFSLEKARFGEL